MIKDTVSFIKAAGMNISDMNFRLVLLLWLLNYSSAQDANCDFYQTVAAGNSYYVYSPNYPNNYSAGRQCRWIADCPQGYNCRLDCPEISLPQSSGCTLDRLLVSRSGDAQLNAAEAYCGRRTLSVTSTGQRIAIGLISNNNSPGGRFQCQLTAQLSTTAPPPCSCGERRQNRIVGGQETGVNEFKMMVGIADGRINQIKCGGVIISDFYVLTAAHCLVNQSVRNYAVVVGEHDVTTGDSPATKAYAIDRFTTHPQFNPSNYDYDVGIVKVATAIEFNDRVGPVCLPFKFRSSSFAGSKVTVLGWGTLSFGGPTSKVLRKVDLDVLTQSDCRSRGAPVTDRQMCTFTPGKDACQDDSGGPALFSDPSTGLYFGVGIISYGRFCASNTPGTLTRVTALLDWIVNNTPQTNNYCVK